MSLTAATTNTIKQTSLGQYPSMNGSRAMTGVKQIRTSVMMFGSVHMGTASLAERLDDALADRLERVEHPVTRQRHRLEVRRTLDPLAILLRDQPFPLSRGV